MHPVSNHFFTITSSIQATNISHWLLWKPLNYLSTFALVNPPSSLFFFLTQQPQWSFKIISYSTSPLFKTFSCACCPQRKARLIPVALNYLHIVIFHLISTAPFLFHFNLPTGVLPQGFQPVISSAWIFFLSNFSDLLEGPISVLCHFSHYVVRCEWNEGHTCCFCINIPTSLCVQ